MGEPLLRSNPSRLPEPLPVFGVPIRDVDGDAVVGFIAAEMAASRRSRILYANAHLLNLAYDHPSITTYFQEADLVVCDGYGAALAAWVLHGRRPSRQTPPDWIDRLAALAAGMGYRVFLLGSSETASRGAAEALRARHADLEIVGVLSGYHNKETLSEENRAVVRAINEARTDILIVGFGMPLQEQWLWANWGDLRCGTAITVGAMFDFLSGEVYRAPRWITDRGLEWASRLIAEPRRLWRRYLIGLPVLLVRVLVGRLRRTGQLSTLGR